MVKQLREFWYEYKVRLIGLAVSLLMLLQQLTADVKNVDWWAVVMAVGLAAAGWVGKNLRGQANSIVGLVGNAGVAIGTVHETGHFTWYQVAIQFAILYFTTSLPDPKSRGYEQTDVIRGAKIEGEIISPAALTNSDIKKEAQEIIKSNN